MFEHSIYFLSYAVILTMSAMVVAAALYSRNKNDGTPINYTMILIVSGIALAMWTGVAVTEYAYEPNTLTRGFVMLFIFIWLSAGLTWQVNSFMNKNKAAKIN